MFEELEKDIEHFSSHGSILLMGDLSFDNELNRHGERLLELCKSADLRILNYTVNGDSLGRAVFHGKNGITVVHYVICNQDIFSLVANSTVKESLYLSDHGLKIKTGKTRRRIKLSSNKKRFDKKCRLKRHELGKLANKKHKDPLNSIIREQYHDTDAIQEENIINTTMPKFPS